jgi:chromosome segregation ATPase
MKIVRVSLLSGVALLTLPGLAQVSQSDPQTLNEILAEVRAIHADVRLSETTQILLAELQLQQSAVNAAIQHRDASHTSLTQMQAQEKAISAEIARIDDPDSELQLDPVRKNQLAEQSAAYKARMPTLKTQEEQLANDLQDAESRVTSEQMKLSRIQSQLDDAVKKLQPPITP